MNMSQESYIKEITRQIDNCQAEITVLGDDYKQCSDDICKSQIRTLLEKKEYTLINLIDRKEKIEKEM